MQNKTYRYNVPLLQKVMKRKLEFFGHTARMNNRRKIKSVLMGTMDRDNRKGRPHCRKQILNLPVLQTILRITA